MVVLAVEDGGEVRPVPDLSTVLKPGRHMLVYGEIDVATNLARPGEPIGQQW